MHTVRLLIRCLGAFRRRVKRLELDARGVSLTVAKKDGKWLIAATLRSLSKK
jgi:hypothetical protein